MNCICGNLLDNSPDGLQCFFCFLAQEQGRDHMLSEAEELAKVEEQERDDQAEDEDLAVLDEIEDYSTSFDLADEYLLLFDD
jgi:DNA-binding protein H-NS